MIKLINPQDKESLSLLPEGLFQCNKNSFPLVNGVYHIAEEKNNYTTNFGFQWKKFKRTQLDKFNKTNFSKERFFSVTNWDKENLEGKNILEAGCGAGRFTQIVLDYTNADLYSIDFSESVEANYENNGPHPRLKLFQCSIYAMPFVENSFEKIFCFGVLQHTPDPQKTIEGLISLLKPNGELILDFYPYNGFWTKINAKYVLRPFLKNISNKKLLSLIKLNIHWMIPLSNFFLSIKLDRIFNRFIPICDIKNVIPENLSKVDFYEWVTLDTFDMFSPKYDQPLKINTVKKWLEKFGLKIKFAGFVNYNKDSRIAIVKAIK